MSSMSPQPRSATNIYAGIVAAVTTIVVSIVLFRKLRETGNTKSRDKGISKQVGHANTSHPPSIDQDARDERKSNVSIPAHSTTPLAQPVDHSAGEESHLGISVMSHAPLASTTSEAQFINQDARAEPNRAIQLVDHSAGNKGQLGTSVPSETPPLTSELQLIDQNARDKSISIPAQASTTSRPHDGIGSEEYPSVTLSQGSSNFQISETNATIIRNGDGRFTKIQRNLAYDYITDSITLPNINYNLKKHILTEAITTLPRAEAGFKGYRNNKSEHSFKGTRVARLQEIADCVTSSESGARMYILSGLAGKSTVAYTIASRAADLNLLGASFVFSRYNANRNNAKRFFTTIAYQLCVYDETFAKAIGDALKTKGGSAATGKYALWQDQLQSLILDPLRSIVQSRSRPILIVIDALNECDEKYAISVLTGLSRLVQDLPSFRVILTTRPQPYLDRFLSSQAQGGHTFIHLQDIENKVDGDIRLYLDRNLSMKPKCFPMQQLSASDEDINFLVCAAGKSFFIASMAVRYILDTSASNPAAQIQKLLRAYTQDPKLLEDLDCFYTVILRDVVPEDCDDDDIVSRYQIVVGTIISVQHPLPVSALAQLIGIDMEEIRVVLDKLQSVILLGDDDVPRLYHESFSEYLTDQSRCKDSRLQIDPGARAHHTQIAIHCFEIMNKHLKHNILGLGHPARFMSNEDGLREDGITDEQLEEKIPQQLRYACVYWFAHLEAGNIEDATLMNGLEKFADEHMLYWLESLSLIGQLDSAYLAIHGVIKLFVLKRKQVIQKRLHQLLFDALRFIAKFKEIIEGSALHTYYSALSFTPTDSLLYHQYNKEAVHTICAIEGGPEKWDSLLATMWDEISNIRFSLDSTLFVSCPNQSAWNQGMLKIWDAVTGILISTIPGDRFAVANDCCTVASSQDNIATLYNMNGSPSGTMLTASSKIEELALSSESSRVAAALSDGTVWLWDSRNAKVIESFDGFEIDSRKTTERLPCLQFSSTGTRLVYSSAEGIVKLRDGISGRSIADLQCGSWNDHRYFEFSGDGSRMASLSAKRGLALWDSESGGLIASGGDKLIRYFNDFGRYPCCLAISADGSLLATADPYQVTLWTENRNHLAKIKVLDVGRSRLMTFLPDNILAIAISKHVKLYNVKSHSFASTLSLHRSIQYHKAAQAISPDCTRFAAAQAFGSLKLWDIQSIDTSGPPSSSSSEAEEEEEAEAEEEEAEEEEEEEEDIEIAITLSRDCSRLACGFKDGTVELWDTWPTKRRIASHQAHQRSVLAIEFSPDDGLFASLSGDLTIKLWNGGDGSPALCGTFENGISSATFVGLLNSGLVTTHNAFPLWTSEWISDTPRLIRVFFIGYKPYSMSFAENNALIAIPNYRGVSLHDAARVNRGIITTFDVSDTLIGSDEIRTITFLPDKLHLVAQSKDGVFLSFNLINKHVSKGATLAHIIQLPDISLWHGVPIWHDDKQHCFTALFSQDKSPVPVLWIPEHIRVTKWTQGSSIIALGCADERVILVRLPTSHIG